MFYIVGTKAVFNLLFAQPTEFDLKTSKVQQAEKKGVGRARTILYESCS